MCLVQGQSGGWQKPVPAICAPLRETSLGVGADTVSGVGLGGGAWPLGFWGAATGLVGGHLDKAISLLF